MFFSFPCCAFFKRLCVFAPVLLPSQMVFRRRLLLWMMCLRSDALLAVWFSFGVFASLLFCPGSCDHDLVGVRLRDCERASGLVSFFCPTPYNTTTVISVNATGQRDCNTTAITTTTVLFFPSPLFVVVRQPFRVCRPCMYPPSHSSAPQPPLVVSSSERRPWSVVFRFLFCLPFFVVERRFFSFLHRRASSFSLCVLIPQGHFLVFVFVFVCRRWTRTSCFV